MKFNYLLQILFSIFLILGCTKTTDNEIPTATSKKLKKAIDEHGFETYYYYSNGFFLDSTVRVITSTQSKNYFVVEKYTYDRNLIQFKTSYHLENDTIVRFTNKVDTFNYIGDSLINNKLYDYYVILNENIIKVGLNVNQIYIENFFDTKENPFYLIEGFKNSFGYSKNNLIEKINYDGGKKVYKYRILYNNLVMPYEIRDLSTKKIIAKYEYF